MQAAEESIMTHVNLDDKPEAVRHFFRDLPVGAEGSVLELHGKPVARLFPAVPVRQDIAGWSPESDRRRCELLDRKYGEGLTNPESEELAELQSSFHSHLDSVAPLPLEALRGLHRRLMEQASGT
jgi:hypothetical protein